MYGKNNKTILPKRRLYTISLICPVFVSYVSLLFHIKNTESWFMSMWWCLPNAKPATLLSSSCDTFHPKRLEIHILLRESAENTRNCIWTENIANYNKYIHISICIYAYVNTYIFIYIYIYIHTYKINKYDIDIHMYISNISSIYE